MFSLALLAATAASAGAAMAQEDSYGAIAYSRDDGAYGYSYDLGSRGLAEERAMRECSKQTEESCEVVLWFRNSCAALATDDEHDWGAAWNVRQSRAEDRALELCRESAANEGHADTCEVVRWACTSR
ncbi:MAG: hypothetical protein QOG83_2060 [Alphaproteobacteria bacterium]|jgi:hypothetical protein|nr:hypothetical protein [Alphaproteobacteria bacterium]